MTVMMIGFVVDNSLVTERYVFDFASGQVGLTDSLDYRVLRSGPPDLCRPLLTRNEWK
jgi:hypothetical protein